MSGLLDHYDDNSVFLGGFLVVYRLLKLPLSLSLCVETRSPFKAGCVRPSFVSVLGSQICC